MANKWSMPRGDYDSMPVTVPANVYTPGGKLFFAAKVAVDNDTSDSLAAAKKTMTDDDIIETDSEGNKIFLLQLQKEDTNLAEPGKYLGEFQYVDVNGKPKTWPAFDFILLGDINRRTT